MASSTPPNSFSITTTDAAATRSDQVTGSCAICGDPSTRRCKPCGVEGKSIYYCSPEHQVQDWTNKGHKKVCSATLNRKAGIETKSDPEHPELGLKYFAARDLPAGHLIFSKDPLLLIPRAHTPKETDIFAKQPSVARLIETSGSTPVTPEICTCVGCSELILYGYRVVDPPHPTAIAKCDKCTWPVHAACNEAESGVNPCEKVHKRECKILTNAGLTWGKIRDRNFAYKFLGVLRALTLTSEDGLGEFSKLPLKKVALEDAEIEEVLYWLKVCGFNLDKNLLRLCMMKIKSNVLQIQYFFEPTAKHGFVIYKGPPAATGRIFPHSCTPNVVLVFNPVSMKGHFKILCPVKKGDELRLNYLIYNDIHPMLQFRMKLLAELGTSCDCRRCSDTATEGGTYSTAIKCKGGEDHWFLPRPAYNAHGTILYFYCDKCKTTKTTKEYNTLIVGINNDFAIRKEEDSTRSCLLKYSGHVIHPNNNVLLINWIKLGTVVVNQIIRSFVHVEDPSQFAYDLHKKYLPDLERVLELMNLMHPGRVQLTGQFMYGHSVLLISQLAEELKAANQIHATGGDGTCIGHYEDRIGKIIDEARVAWIIINENPHITTNRLYNYIGIRKMYANNLVAAMEACITSGANNGNGGPNPTNDSKYKTFKDEFADPEFDITKSYAMYIRSDVAAERKPEDTIRVANQTWSQPEESSNFVVLE